MLDHLVNKIRTRRNPDRKIYLLTRSHQSSTSLQTDTISQIWQQCQMSNQICILTAMWKGYTNLYSSNAFKHVTIFEDVDDYCEGVQTKTSRCNLICVSRHHGCPIEDPPLKSLAPSQHNCIEGFKGNP